MMAQVAANKGKAVKTYKSEEKGLKYVDRLDELSFERGDVAVNVWESEDDQHVLILENLPYGLAAVISGFVKSKLEQVSSDAEGEPE